MKLVIRSQTKLTKSGEIGAYLFVLSPIAAIVFGALYYSDLSKNTDQSLGHIWAIFVLASIASFLSGYVMMNMGKETISHAVSGDDA